LNQETILAMLPNSPKQAKTMKEIAQELRLDITDGKWFEVERSLYRTLKKLVRWGLVDYDYRQNTNGNRYWYNAYWKSNLMWGKRRRIP
jgi:predicted transcriptional regulator